jgi:hypothetical protein
VNSIDTFSFNEVITLDDAETALRRLGVAPEYLSPIRIDLTAAKHIEIGAGVRIGNALRRYRTTGLEVLLPTSYAHNEDWRLLDRSGLGLAIALHASDVYALKLNVTQSFKKRFSASHVAEQNLMVIQNIHRTGEVNFDDHDAFSSAFYSHLPTLNVPPAALNMEALRSIIEFAREAILNVRDHSYKKPLPSDTAILSYFSLRYYKGFANLTGAVEPLKYYMRRIKHEPDAEKIIGYLEVIVNDDGVGIAARQSLRGEIYWAPAAQEEEALLQALKAGGSIKPVALDTIARGDPGFGFNVMAESLRKLRGFAAIRSGRYLLACDGMRKDPLSLSFKLARGRFSSQLGYMPGTFIQALIPFF